MAVLNSPAEPALAITSPDLTNSPCFLKSCELCLYTDNRLFPWSNIITNPVSTDHSENITVPSAIALIVAFFFVAISMAKWFSLLLKLVVIVPVTGAKSVVLISEDWLLLTLNLSLFSISALKIEYVVWANLFRRQPREFYSFA